MASLTIDNARKSYGPVEVLKGINIEVDDGGFLVLLGPSGCGKSTLLNMIAGLETITDGEIRIGEDRMNDLHPKDRDIAMVFQSYALYPNMTVEQNIAFGMEMRGVPKPEREKTIGEVAKLLQIEPLLKRKPSQLSGGQRQRVAIGRALTRHPKVFLFDEPLSNLDAKLRVEMRTEIKKLHHRLGVTIVYVTHDQIEAMTMGTHIAIMHGGEVQQFGPPQEVYDRPANTFVATFIGSPSMNLIPAHISDDGLSVIVDRIDGSRTVLPLYQPNDAQKAAAGKAVKLGLRPEHISDPRSQEAHSEHHHEISALVEVTEPTGPDTLAVIILGGIECTARMRADTDAKDEEWANFMVDMSKASLFDPDSGLRIG